MKLKKIYKKPHIKGFSFENIYFEFFLNCSIINGSKVNNNRLKIFFKILVETFVVRMKILFVSTVFFLF